MGLSVVSDVSVCLRSDVVGASFVGCVGDVVRVGSCLAAEVVPEVR